MFEQLPADVHRVLDRFRTGRMDSRTPGRWGTTVEAPDPGALARFYAAPPDWHPGHEGPGTAVVAPSARGSFLVFRQADGYRPPAGPRRRAGSAR